MRALLFPTDMQDVSRAMNVLCTTMDIRLIKLVGPNPTEATIFRSLCLLGDMLDALVNPFILPTLSLSEQITMLSKFGHIACKLYWDSKGAFMPHQLYGDFASLVCAAVWQVGWAKILDPVDGKAFLCLLGDNVLEELFGMVRMIGGHDPNFDPDIIRHRMGQAMRAQAVANEYPHLLKPRRRLQLVRTRDVDHLSPRNWTGDLRVSQCDLHKCWMAGMKEAEASLAAAERPTNFMVELWNRPGRSLMCPDGKSFPGLSKEFDRSQAEWDDLEGADAAESGFEGTSDARDAIRRDVLAFRGEKAVEEERQAAEAHPSEPFSQWFRVSEDGAAKEVIGHKKTAHRLEMNSPLDVSLKNSPDRLIRVMYNGLGNSKRHDPTRDALQDRPDSNENIFTEEDVFATLVSVFGSFTCIAILQCTGIQNGQHSALTVPLDEVARPDSSCQLSGQVFPLVPYLSPEGKLRWIAHAGWVGFQARKGPAQPQLKVEVDGSMVIPLPCRTLQSIIKEDVPPELLYKLTSASSYWVFDNGELERLQSTLQERAMGSNDLLAEIPRFQLVKGGGFPYNTTGSSKPNSLWSAFDV